MPDYRNKGTGKTGGDAESYRQREAAKRALEAERKKTADQRERERLAAVQAKKDAEAAERARLRKLEEDRKAKEAANARERDRKLAEQIRKQNKGK